jgi:ketosteroid isomerase-like protein
MNNATMLIAGLLACAPALAADSGRAALEAAGQRWMAAVNARDSAALSRTMTEDVELLDDRGTVTGRDQAVKALLVSAGGKLLAASREVTMTGDLAWRVVNLSRLQKNRDVQARGHALEIWIRIDGEWKLHRRMTTASAAPEISLTRPSPDEPVLDRP